MSLLLFLSQSVYPAIGLTNEFLRPMAGYTLWNKKRSSDIKEQMSIFNINDKLMQYKINWREHIQRIQKVFLNYKPEGRRNIGTPQRDGDVLLSN